MSNTRVLIIIPAYNEQDCIVDTVNKVRRAGYDYIIINDGSKDDTLALCRTNGLNVLNLTQNLGIGGAVQAGHMFAYQHGYDIDIQFDGDGQHDIEYVPLLIQSIKEGSDLAIGSRFVKKTDGFQSTAMRRVGISWLSGWLKLFTGVVTTDPTSGFRACNRRAMKLFCRKYPIDYPEPESIAAAAKAGFIINDVPVLMHERQGGKSSIGVLSGAFYMIKVSLAIAITCITRRGIKRKKK